MLRGRPRLARRSRWGFYSEINFYASPLGMTINLRTGQCYPHRPEDYCTKIAAADPENAGECPLWHAFLHRVTDEDLLLQHYLQRVAGYCMTGSTREHVMFFLYGTGANGKGIFLNTLRAIWNDYAAVAPIEMFCETRNERHPTELAFLRGVRLVVAQETERNQRWAESKVKTLTGGDPITARYMRQDFFTFTPQFKLMIAGNHKPSLRGVDEAIRRRMHLIPFTVTIPEAERDTELFDKLRAEWDAILAWAVEGCLEWQRTGLNPPPAVRNATDNYLAEEDTVGKWIDESCALDPIYSARSSELYASWKKWAKTAGEHAGSQKRLSQALIDRGFQPRRNNAGQSIFEGIALKP
jgi:putative DNA primase/helicase